MHARNKSFKCGNPTTVGLVNIQALAQSLLKHPEVYELIVTPGLEVLKS